MSLVTSARIIPSHTSGKMTNNRVRGHLYRASRYRVSAIPSWRASSVTKAIILPCNVSTTTIAETASTDFCAV